jgi:hypothetical protein
MLMSMPGVMQGPALPGQNGGPAVMPGADPLGNMPRLEPRAQPIPADPTVRGLR